jgi:hypothetical protein
MKTIASRITIALGLAFGGAALPAAAEPLMTLVGFEAANYENRGSNEIVVRITRTDQDAAAEDQELTVDLAAGGDAIENVDFRFSARDSDGKPGRITFAPGVKERIVTVYVLQGGQGKKLQLSLSNPSSPGTAVTGENPSAVITFVN